jgi:dTDP-4-amino-4,6-dideoxygalactose transaminase
MGQKPRVPFLDLRLQHEGLRSEIDERIGRVLDSGQFILGESLADFEAAFARYCGCEHAVGVSSGTAALHLLLVAHGVGPGDEVVTVANSFVATAEAIRYTGARPVLVDVDPGTYCMDPAALERAVSPRTRAVIPVHLYGQPCAMDAILAVAHRCGAVVIEDACQAHGATLGGRKTGALGDAAAFSFYPTKNLGALGDGGAVTTNDGEIARKVTALRHHAQYEPNVFPELGFNARLDTLQAVVLDAKLARLDGWNQRRRAIAARYEAGLAESDYAFQARTPGSQPVHHILTVGHARRAAVQEALTAAGIGWGRHITEPVHRQPGYRSLLAEGETLPVSERLARELVSLPAYPELEDAQVDYVVDVLSRVEVSV